MHVDDCIRYLIGVLNWFIHCCASLMMITHNLIDFLLLISSKWNNVVVGVCQFYFSLLLVQNCRKLKHIGSTNYLET